VPFPPASIELIKNIVKTKFDAAIDFIQEHEPDEGYFLGFSGGKDSVVLYDVVVKSGVKFKAYYSATGIDPPEIVRFIRKEFPDIEFKYPKRSFFAELKRRGFPTRGARWCCDFLKKEPTYSIPLYHRLMGIRAEESYKRKNRGKINKFGKFIIYSPLFDWKFRELWMYIDLNRLPYCSLYDVGFDRLGCVICPFICSKDKKVVDIHKKRWPRQYKAFEKAMYILWEKKEHIRQEKFGYSNSFDEFLDNWYMGVRGGDESR